MPVYSSVFPQHLQIFRFYLKSFDLSFNQFLYKMRGRCLVLVFYICRLPVFFSTICWRGCLFSNVCFWFLCEKIRWLQQFRFISESFILFHCSLCLLLCLYHAIFVTKALKYNFAYYWIPVLWQLLCSFCSGLLLLFRVLYLSGKIKF
jgi:hypothetical protein